jgi:hypothetical protein
MLQGGGAARAPERYVLAGENAHGEVVDKRLKLFRE